jgi:hypothetical protein
MENENQNLECIENNIKTNSILILKFDEPESKYNEFYNKIIEDIPQSTNYKFVNITDKEIIDFYDIDTLPTIYVYKNKNLLGVIEGFHLKTSLLKKINNLLQ